MHRQIRPQGGIHDAAWGSDYTSTRVISRSGLQGTTEHDFECCKSRIAGDFYRKPDKSGHFDLTDKLRSGG